MAPTDTLSVYRELADHYDRLGQPAMRDRFLILAADAALQAGQPEVAEQLRQRLLHGSRHHMLRSYASFAEAAAARDVQTYLRDLRVNYPPEIAREMLDDLQPRELTPGEANGPIPPTAPLMDLYAQPSQPRQWQAQGPVEAYPLIDEREQTPAPPKPLAQPLPGRAVPKRAEARRATAALPVAAPSPRPLPAAPSRRPRERSEAAGWLGVVLGGVVLLAALAAAAFTVAQPFLP